MLDGMMFSKKSVKPRCCAVAVYPAMAFGIQRGRIDVHFPAGMKQDGGNQSHQERDGGDHLEEEQSLGTEPISILQVAHTGNADDDAGKSDDGSKRHADQPDKSQRLQRDRMVGEGDSHEDAKDDGHQHL